MGVSNGLYQLFNMRVRRFLQELRVLLPEDWKYELRVWHTETEEEWRINTQGAHQHAPPKPVHVELIEVRNVEKEESKSRVVEEGPPLTGQET